MGEFVDLDAKDGAVIGAYVAAPDGDARGGVVVAQEMYGITGYLRRVCDRFAAAGYLAIAPALYDRIEKSVACTYSPEGHERAKALSLRVGWDDALDDLESAAAVVRPAGKVALVGLCWGGTMAWLAACRKHFDCAVSYYGSEIADFAGERAKCPTLIHIGEEDRTITPDERAAFRAAQPDIPFHLYPGTPHGFDNEDRGDRFVQASADLARRRTLEFLQAHIG